MLTGPIQPYSRYELHHSTLVAEPVLYSSVSEGEDVTSVIGCYRITDRARDFQLDYMRSLLLTVDLITPPTPATPTREYHSLSAMDPI